MHTTDLKQTQKFMEPGNTRFVKQTNYSQGNFPSKKFTNQHTAE